MRKMGRVSTDHHHKKLHHHLLSPAKKMSHLQDVLINNIPPRKLISRTSSTDSDDSGGGAACEPDSDPYSSDQFRMFEFKIRQCTRSRSHDWTDCPFAHPGEKARRRDPRKFHYSGSVCPEFRRSGTCSRGDDCEFAHGVFEVWMHPSRYRTEACKDGKNCKRKVCFFAHSPRELRLLPSDSSDGEGGQNGNNFVGGVGDVMMMRVAAGAGNGTSHCCKHCNCLPRSTLQLTSPPLSPPSPSQFAWAGPQMAYEDALSEIMSSLEAMNFKEAYGHSHEHDHRGLWVDVVGVDHGVGDEHQQFVLSPSTPMGHIPVVCLSSSRGNSNLSLSGGYGYDSPCSSRSGVGSGYSFDSPMSSSTAGGYKAGLDQVEEIQVMVMNEQSMVGMGDPDLGWVNDLLT